MDDTDVDETSAFLLSLLPSFRQFNPYPANVENRVSS